MAEKTQLWVIVYDVHEEAPARQLRELLRYSGTRIRNCVYEIAATPPHLRRLLDQMALHLDEADNVRVYRICPQCQSSTYIFGDGELTGRPTAIIV